MKFLLVHNFYQQPGGEDAVFEAERQLLLAAGHQVTQYGRHNSEIASYGPWQEATLGFRTVWAWDSAQELRRILDRDKPSVAHFHNTFPLISPAAYYVCRAAGVPVVQTLHNYRLFCPAATFLRQGRICEECVEHSLWRAVRYGCYRESRSASAATSLMLTVHRWRQTWTQMVDCYVTPSSFARSKFIDAGLVAEKIFVKPNFVHPDPGLRQRPGDYALFVGRILPEKGLNTLLNAWKLIGDRVPLRVVGDGPALGSLKARAVREGLSSISIEGQKTFAETMATIKGARFLVFPSEGYETFGRTIAEAFACGVPVLASRLGVMTEILEDGRTGIHFTPGDAGDLAEKVTWAWNSPRRLEEMSREARREYETKYTAERNYPILMDIYAQALAQSPSKGKGIHAKPRPPHFEVLGVRVHAVQVQDVIGQIERWITEGASGCFVAATGMHAIVEACHDSTFRKILNAANLVVPDGMPLVLLGRRRGHALGRRVYGPELMFALCEKTAGRGFRHFFYGGAPGVAARLAESLERKCGISAVGNYSPPFRALTEQEEEEIVRLIRAAAPDVLWVGLGTPKQERWMFEHRRQLQVPVMIGVGAAFDINGGQVREAPTWMREHGFEWLFRLLREPRRLWRRYLIYGSEFVFRVFAESIGVKRAD